MTEYEYDQMLHDVAWAMEDGVQDNVPRSSVPRPSVSQGDGSQDNASRADVIRLPLRAANDNSVEWPLLPFPGGWSASC